MDESFMNEDDLFEFVIALMSISGDDGNSLEKQL